MIGGVKTIDCNDVNPDLLMLDSYNSCDGGIKTEPGMMYAGGKTYITLDNKGWQGSTTTILEERTLPVAVCEDFNSSYSQHSDSNSNSRPETPVTGVRGRRPGRKAAKAVELEEEQGSPEEQERLRIRRERNKEAAARCRKRKMDQIETLEQQVADWEAKNSALQKKLVELKEERDAATFMLENHDCLKTYHHNITSVGAASHQQISTSGYQLPPPIELVTTTNAQPILRVPQHNHSHHNNLQMSTAPTTVTLATKSHPAVAKNATRVTVVKSENSPQYILPTVVGHSTTEEMLNNPTLTNTTSATEFMSAPTTVTTFSDDTYNMPLAKKSRRSRPESLSLSVRPQNLRSVIAGIDIETPTKFLNTPTFDALMDGRTGLTPTNILTPVSISLSALATPVLSSPTCSSQQRSNATGANKNFELMSL